LIARCHDCNQEKHNTELREGSCIDCWHARAEQAEAVVTQAVLRYSTNPPSLVGMFRDMTRRKRMKAIE
jgi:hypothetical protein